jgi:chromosomal replication initiation ATPase DnaA
MAVLREARASLPEIGAALGCHHTTVMAGLRRIKKLDLELAEARAISSRLVDGKRKAA